MEKATTTKLLGIPAGIGFLSGIIILIVCLLFSTIAKAQLSGTYTIGSGGNYSSFSNAIADLSSKGVSAAVTFNVSASTFSEAVTIPAITGASTTNTITFQGAGRTKSFITNSSNVITFKNCSFITFTGFNITNTASSNAIYANYAINCAITNCDIMCSASATYCIYDNYTLNFNIGNNHISGGNYGIYINSTGGSSSYANNIYQNNRIVGFGYMAFYANYTNNCKYLGNVIDSSANGYGYGFYTLYEDGAIYNGNKIIAAGLYYPVLMYYPNYSSYYSAGTTGQMQFTNNYMSGYQYYAFFYFYYSNNCKLAHNTFYGGNYYPLYLEAYYAVGNISFISNNCISTSASYGSVYFYEYGSTWPAPYVEIDGNNYFNTAGGPLVQGSNTVTFSYNKLSDWQAYMSAYQYTSAYNGSTNPFEAFASHVNTAFVNAPTDLHLDQKKMAASGVYAGIDADIDGDIRCKLFPTAGCDESFNGKTKPIVKWFAPSGAYPNSPTYIYQTAKAGEPKAHQWYIYNSVYGSSSNYYKIPHTLSGDSVTLKTSLLTAGMNRIRLVTNSCGGTDNYTDSFKVTAPLSVPYSDFIADKNKVQAGDVVSFKDLSTNGPIKWIWTISPATITLSGNTVPTYKFIFGSLTSQNPQIVFLYGGKYDICLTTANGVGKGNTYCKTNYINVLPSVNMGSVSVVHDPSGYLYDNGGPNGNYLHDNSNGYVESLLIDPCADSVYLSFSMFDTYCGYDYVRLYEGRTNAGKNLTGKCATTSTYYSGGGGGNGFTGGKAFPGCPYQCMPNVVKPDTFKAKNTMLVEMSTYEGYNLGAGFAAYWWSTPRTTSKPTANYHSSQIHDSVCVNHSLTFTNTTKIDPNDPATFLWDLDGDSTTFECVGNCTTATYPYFLPGKVKTRLIATNCGGSDTFIRILTVYYPKAPLAQFTADNTNPTTNDQVYFTPVVKECVDDYLWTIVKAAINKTNGKAVFVNGTSATSANPVVNFTDTGYYDVTLFVDNGSGVGKSTKTITTYIHVRSAYCIPSVANLVKGIGISKVSFNTINHKTLPQAAQDYSNFTTDQNLSTTVSIGAPYNLVISRDSTAIFDSINRTVYIDWNQDGSFVGKGEIIARDSNSLAKDLVAKITVPKNAKPGATVMRIATNLGKYSNKPCGINEFGEYQDYRIYVTPYKTLPVITLLGHQGLLDTIYIEQGHVFTEPGYSAFSYLYGNITKSVWTTTITFGKIHVITYHDSDSVGNIAIAKYRVVKETPDKTPPDLNVASPDTTYIKVTKTPVFPVSIPIVISAYDLVDGNMAWAVKIDTGGVKTNIVGTYIVTYKVSDLSGNMAGTVRVIKVIDNIAPTLKLLGLTPTIVLVHNKYVEQGAQASDNYYSPAVLNPSIVISGNVDTGKIGTYSINYNLSDPSGNKAVPVSRVVKVVDTIAPVLSFIGSATDSIPVFSDYNDPGIIVSDNNDKISDISIQIGGTFYSIFKGGKNAYKTGTYTIIYKATDKSGNISTLTRVVKVKDYTPPTLTLKGDAAVSVCRWFAYADAGVDVSDNYDKAGSIAPIPEGTFISNGGTTMYGLLTLRYKGVDVAGNEGYSPWRYIQVKNEDDFTCATGINSGVGLDKFINIYPNPSNGVFTINISTPDQQKTRISLMNLMGQEIQMIYNGNILNNSMLLNLQNEPEGIYFISITTEKETVIKKIQILK